jgi:hypothetical protein
MKNKICEAIRNKNLLEFYYNGYHRVVEPHTLGVSKKNNDILSAFQIRGESESDKSSPWRLFDLVEMENMRVLEEKFSGHRDGYKKGDKRMIQIWCEI